MTLPEPHQIGRALASRFGIAFTVTVGKDSDGPWFDVMPADLHPNEGFTVRTQFGWRSIGASFRPGRFAADLIGEMNATAESGAPAFVAMARLLDQAGGKLAMSINSREVNPLEPPSWTGAWQSLSLSVRKSPHLVDHGDSAAVEWELLFWGGGILGMALSLIPTEELAEEAEAGSMGLPEGAKLRVEVNRYERSRINRAVCIAAHGTVRKACDFDFAADRRTGRPEGFPFDVTLIRSVNWADSGVHDGAILPIRIAPPDREPLRRRRIERAIESKRAKLAYHKSRAAYTVLALENSDLALTNHALVGEHLVELLGTRPPWLDELFFICTTTSTWTVHRWDWQASWWEEATLTSIRMVSRTHFPAVIRDQRLRRTS